MVDAQPAGVREHGAQHVPVGGVPGGGQPVRAPRRQAPVLPRWLNVSGGAPTSSPMASTSCSAQASAPSGSTPTARSCTTPMAIPRAAASSRRPTARRTAAAPRRETPSAAGPRVGRRPGAAVRSGQRDQRGPCRSASAQNVAKSRNPSDITGRGAPSACQSNSNAARLACQTASWSIRSLARRPHRASTSARAGSARAVPADVGDPQVQRVDEAAARRPVRRGLHGKRRARACSGLTSTAPLPCARGRPVA